MQWLGISKSHEVYLRRYWRECVDEEYHGDDNDPLPETLWMDRPFIWAFGD